MSSHSSPQRDEAEGPYEEAITMALPSILYTRRAATTCRPSHVSNRSKITSFQANIMPPDRPEPAMKTCDSPLPQPSDVQIRCSRWVSIVSCRHMTSAPHSRRYRLTMPRLRSSRSPCTFQEMHFMMNRPMHPPRVRLP